MRSFRDSNVPERSVGVPDKGDGSSILEVPKGSLALEGLIRGIGSDNHRTRSEKTAALIAIFERMKGEGREFTSGVLCLLAYHVARNLKGDALASRGNDSSERIRMRPEFFYAVSSEAYRLLDQGLCEPRQIVLMARSLATVGVNDGKILSVLVSSLSGRLNELSPGECVHLVWGFSTLGGADREFYRKLSEALLPKAHLLSAPDLANVIWSFAKSPHRDRAIYRVAVAQLFHRLTGDEYRGGGQLHEYLLTNVVWGLAKVGFRDERLMKLIGDSLSQQDAAINVKTAPHLLWSYASLSVYHPRLVPQLVRIIERDIDVVSPSNTCNALWALSLFNTPSLALFEKASELTPEQVGNLNVLTLSRLAWGCANQGYRDDRLMQSISIAVQEQSRSLLPQVVVNLAWAFATLGVKDEPLFRTLRDYIAVDVHFFPAKLHATTIWAFAVHHAHLLDGVCSRENLSALGYDDAGWMQVYNALIVADMVKPNERYRRYEEIVARYVLSPPNNFELSVERTVRDILRGYAYTLEHQAIFAGIPTDILVKFEDGRTIAIECDGDRYHQLWGPSGALRGRTGRDHIQDAIFLKSGVDRVFHILSSEFFRAPADLPALAAYVRDASSL